MEKLLFRNADVVLADRVLTAHNVLVQDGTIQAVTPDRTVPAQARVIEAEGCFLLPGFIDTHVHGGGGADFMDGTPDAFETVVRTHAVHGTTSIMPTTVACPLPDLLDLFRLYRTMQRRDLPADLLGIHLEGPYISQTMRGAQNPLYVRDPAIAEIRTILEEAGDLIARCTMAPEIDGASEAARLFSEAGVQLAIGHSNAVSTDVFRAYDAGFRHITHFYCNTPGTRKIGQTVYAGIQEAAYLLDGMTVDLIGDGKHIPADLMKMVMKIKGTDHVILITDAMRAAGTDVKESYLGSIRPENRVIVEDGVAKLPDRSYYAGSIATMDRVFRNAVVNYELPVCEVSRMMSLTPAEKLGISDRKGKIAVGCDADLLLMDSTFHLVAVYKNGKEIEGVQT